MDINQAKKILQVSRERNINFDEEGVRAKIKKARDTFVDYYKARPDRFISDFIKINDGKTNEIVAFNLNRAQKELVSSLLNNNRFIAAPKARQLGITTLTNALALWHSIFVKSAVVHCMSVNNDRAQKNLRIIKRMFGGLPDWAKQTFIHFDEKTGHQNNLGLWSFYSKVTKTDVSLQVASASAENAGRGDTPTFLHWTETAFAPEAKEVFTSIFPGLNRKKDSIIILESTGNGNAGFFYDVCLGNVKGFEVLFFPWHYEEEYKEPTEELTDLDKQQIADLMGTAELPDYLTDEQLVWYRSSSLILGKAKNQQEYPVTIEQVFQATSSSYFNPIAIEKILPKEQIYGLKIVNGLLMATDYANCTVFAGPNPENEYLLVVDPSATGEGDAMSLSVFDPDGEEVAHWHEPLAAHDVVAVVHAMARHYNDALVVVESNGPGMYVLDSLRTNFFYTNLYTEGNRLGINTNANNKPVMLAKLQQFIIDGKLRFNNKVMQGEMKIFDASTLSAPKGEHDDTVMSAAIAALVFEIHPPLRKHIKETYRDYSESDFNNTPARRFII